MTFQDIFSKDFLEQLNGSLSVTQILLTLLISLALGLLIFFVYKLSFRGVMYSKSFNVSLVALAMVSSAVILCITSNVVLSLGMVGALSIIRFRTAIKDPIDIVYMFWAIAVGIITGASLYLLAVIACVAVGAVLFVFSRVSVRGQPYLLVVSYVGDEAESAIFSKLGEHAGSYKVKSKTKTPGAYELTVEIRARGENGKLVNVMDALPGVTSAAMVSYDGEYPA